MAWIFIILGLCMVAYGLPGILHKKTRILTKYPSYHMAEIKGSTAVVWSTGLVFIGLLLGFMGLIALK